MPGKKSAIHLRMSRPIDSTIGSTTDSINDSIEDSTTDDVISPSTLDSMLMSLYNPNSVRRNLFHGDEQN